MDLRDVLEELLDGLAWKKRVGILGGGEDGLEEVLSFKERGQLRASRLRQSRKETDLDDDLQPVHIHLFALPEFLDDLGPLLVPLSRDLDLKRLPFSSRETRQTHHRLRSRKDPPRSRSYRSTEQARTVGPGLPSGRHACRRRSSSGREGVRRRRSPPFRYQHGRWRDCRGRVGPREPVDGGGWTGERKRGCA